MSKEMSFLNTGNEIFEVADKAARDNVEVLNGQITEFVDEHNQDAAETVLWEGSLYTHGATITIDDLLTNYDYIDVWEGIMDQTGEVAVKRFVPTTEPSHVNHFTLERSSENGTQIGVELVGLDTLEIDTDSDNILDSTRITLEILGLWSWSGDKDEDAESVEPTSTTITDTIEIIKIVGIKNVVNSELVDIRVGADGTTYQTAGEAVRSQIQQAMAVGGSGLTADVKEALLNCFEHVVWTDEHGQDYGDALEAALYPPANLVSISATYTQSGAVYNTDSLDDLKADLVVTAHMDDGSSETVITYTLSGTLATGSSLITVTYGGKTANFTVIVTEWVTSITAVYTQSGTVYNTDSLDDLKSDLVVTATYADETSETVSDYTLSGTLTVGTSTITVSYGGKTTTFTVTVTAAEYPKTIAYDSDGIGFGNANLTAPTYLANESKSRIHCLGTNNTGYPVKPSTSYKITIPDPETQYVGVRIFNTTAKTAAENSQNISTSDQKDTYWHDISSGSYIFTTDATINSQPVAFVWLAFKKENYGQEQWSSLAEATDVFPIYMEEL